MRKNMWYLTGIFLFLSFLSSPFTAQDTTRTLFGFANDKQCEPLPGVNLNNNYNFNVQKDELKRDVFKGKINLEGKPFKGNWVKLKFSLNPIYDLTDIKVKFIFPESVNFILPKNRDAILDYSEKKNYLIQGVIDTLKNELSEFEVPIVARELGIFSIRVYVEALIENQYKIDQIYFLQIDTFNGEIITPSRNKRTQEIPKPTATFHREQGEETLYPQGNEIVAPADTLATVTVSGTFRYEEVSGNTKPIRYATGELWEDLLFDSKLATSYTSSSGYISFNVSFTGTKTLYIKIINETAAAKANNGWGMTYNAVTLTQTVDSANSSTWSFGTQWIDSSYEHWEAVDNCVDEYQWIDNRVHYTRSQVVINWPWGDWPGSSGDEIDLPTRPVWPWTDYTVYHEYAHCEMYTIYGNSMPSGWGPQPHFVECESSGGFAFKEGFAEFMGCAVPNNRLNVAGNKCLVGDIESNTWQDCIDSEDWDWDGDIIEGCVASIFWDIFDAANDDSLSMDFDEIWTILRTYNPNDINVYWDRWNSLYGAGKELWQIYYDHGINKDSTYPSNPTSISSTSHSISQWSNNNIISMIWSGASDNLSGVKGYSILWDTNTGSIPDTTIDVTGGSASSQSLASGIYYFHLRTCDNANNWNPSAVHRGPYWIDTILPTGSIAINNGQASTTSLIVSLNISASDSGNSGLSQMRFSNNNSTWSTPESYSTLKSNWDLSSYGGNINPGLKTVYAQFKDAAGNWSNSWSDNINYSPQPDIRQPISDIAFGNVNVGSTSDKTTTIYNDGSGTLTVNSIPRSGSSEFTCISPSTPFDIPAGGSQTVTVRFSPTSEGAKSAQFSVNSNDPDEPSVSFQRLRYSSNRPYIECTVISRYRCDYRCYS